MMIHLALTDLLDGARTLVSRERPGRTWKFVGTDSSFVLDFRLLRDGRLRISQGGRVLDESDAGETLAELLRAAEEFAAVHLPPLPEDDAARGDLVASLEDFRAYVAGR
ncbi:hypothetical protein [Streptomyces avicenniae]|uniref:hypothetical protein n=1 Tax=Streptomyces avicenniae TaxID=500153 RepID=UPI000A978691|nr:hypothetical protein [Streptomyces avicenniae]